MEDKEKKLIEARNEQHNNLVSICKKYNYNFALVSKQEIINKFKMTGFLKDIHEFPDESIIITLEKNERKFCIVQYCEYVTRSANGKRCVPYIDWYTQSFALLNNKIPIFSFSKMEYCFIFIWFGFLSLITFLIVFLGGLQVILAFSPFLLLFWGIGIFMIVRTFKLIKKYNIENKEFARKYVFDKGDISEIRKFFTYKLCKDFINLKLKKIGPITSFGHCLSFSIYGKIDEQYLSSLIDEMFKLTTLFDIEY